MANQSINIPTTGTFVFLDSITRVAFEFRTRQSGSFNSLDTWEIQSASGTWSPALQLPTLTDNIYIEANHTVTLTQDESCKAFNYLGGEALTKLSTDGFALNIYGEVRKYTGTAPGTTASAGLGNGTTQWIMGNLNLRGRTRSQGIIQHGAAANNYGYVTNINLDDATQMLTFTGISGQSLSFGATLNVNTGIFKMSGPNLQNRVGLTTGADATQNGILTIGAAGSYIQELTLSPLAITKGATVACAVFTLSTGGKFYYRNEAVSKINAVAITNLGDFYSDLAGAQTLPTGLTSFNNYFNLFLATSGAKTLSQSTVINGKLSFNGTATIALGAFTLTYATTADLEILANKVRGTELPAASSGTAIPRNLIIPTGVNYDLGGVTVNIRGTLQGGGTTSNGTLVQNQP